MERKAWILALGVGALALIGAGLVWSDAPDRDEPARLGEERAARDRARRRVGAAGGGRAGGGSVRPAAGPRAPVAPPDAGVLARVPSAPERPAPTPDDPELPGNAPDAERSAGWQLGQARRRIAILEPRIERYRANLRGLDEATRESRGAQRQRALLERTEQRLEELREQARELEAAARAEGTLGEAERGFEEGETNAEAERPAIEATLPGSGG